ncbi:hypothetical protein BTH55_00670 [Lactobacillus delbrueckii subsp. bulgaricus]|nr:hypothetical protein [Lactobacillus delbrueckii subsp. bulgaricus]MBT8851720.1 hypothetical protein [Lactobacillus delbrueckii subsp. bulgaricus]MBT8853325.1 hypothetical protein [Lactobacillus delbrueckii subsp. bulgaricus]MBT8856526.1 hypothetical protein [Lactobacillus delbrueckii subsp. bulgaricus]
MNRIKQLRTEKSFSLRDLAKDFSAFLDQHGKKPITNVTISRWENEKNSPTAEMWGLLADYFGVSVDYLQGAWSEKEVLELMSSSLLDNYERILKIASRYGEGSEWMLFELIDLKSKHGIWIIDYGKREVTAINEILSDNYMSLAFSIMRFVYFEGICDEERYELELNKCKDPKDAFFRGRIKELGYEQVKNLVSNLHKKSSSKTKTEYLNDYFRKDIYLKSVLSSLVVQKLMAEKVTAETMALYLVTAVNYESMRIVSEYHATGEMKANGRIQKMSQQIYDLSKHVDELQKENDRLKAELASKR